MSVFEISPIISPFESETRIERIEFCFIAEIASAAVLNRSSIATFECKSDETGIDKKELAPFSFPSIITVDILS
jgi:hypothetical protein